MMKRIISLLAAFCLLLTMMPMSVWAKPITEPKTLELPTMTDFRQPRITGLETLEKEPTILPPAKDPSAQINANGDYVSVEEAVAQMRQQMKDRVNNITIKIETTNDDANELFTSIFYDAMEHTGEPGTGDNLMWQWGLLNVGDGFSGYASGGYYYYTLPYEIHYYTTAAMEAELDAAVENLLDDLDLYSASDYDKISGIYAYMTENITYDHYHLDTDPNYEPMYTAYAALVDGTAVCQGYANLFYRLMLELGVDNRIVVGWAGGPHAWNIVELEDWYYYVDSTWDATYAQSGWDYQYFLLGSDYFSLDHTDYVDECPFLPDYPISYTNYAPGQPGQLPPPESWPKTGDCGDNMTWTLTEEGLLTISGTGEMWDFEYQDPEWFRYANQIQKCVVEEGVTGLGDYAFYKCYSLSSIDLPDSLRYTGEGAFTYCESLTSATIPDGVTSIGRQTFGGCTAMTSVTIPVSVVHIGEIAFLYCDMLRDVYYGGSPSQWTQIQIQDNNDCLLNAIIHCAAEDSEPNPDPDPDPDPDAVYTGSCGDNVTWSLTADGMLTISGTGEMWNYADNEPGWYAHVDQVRECVIEEGVASIGAWAFWDCWALERIAVKEGLSVIGEGAFAYCYALRELNLPVSLSTIDKGAFYECYNLEDVFYAGSEAQWSQIAIDELNEDMLNATIHYGAENPAPELPAADYQKIEWELLKLTNRERAKDGREPLTTTQALFQAADIRALELMESYSHDRPGGGSFDTVLSDLGIEFRMAGENKDAGCTSAEEMINAWMGVSDSRNHILGSSYAHMGVGFKRTDDHTYGTYWDQLFYTDEYCHYTGLELNTDSLTVRQGTALEDMDLWATLECGECGECYLPVIAEYCSGFDPDTVGTQTVTVSALNYSDTVMITVTEYTASEPDLPECLDSEWEVLRLTNRERHQNGLDPLTAQDILFKAAGIRAGEITERFDHVRPDNSNFSTILFDVEYPWYMAGENIAAGQWTPYEVVTEWMNSPGHRENILYEEFTHLGVGYVPHDDMYAHYWTQLFTVGWDCSYTDLELGVESVEVEAGTELEEIPLWARATCSYCGDCYLPILPEYCKGYDAETPGTHTVTVTCFGKTDTLQITVLGDEPAPEDPTDPEPVLPPEVNCGTSDEEIQQVLLSLKDQYPEGTPWNDSNSYQWNINNTIGYGCAAFSFILSDAAFGYLPSRTLVGDITIDDLRVGDIIRMYDDTHSAVVLEIRDDHVVLAEGNYNDSIHWGRIYTAAEVMADTTYVITRYPEHHYEDGVCTECGAEDPDAAPDVAYGDVDGDDTINTRDLLVLRRYLNGAEVDVDSTGADLNGDGTINTKDLLMLRKYLNGEEIPLGPQD